MNQSVIKALTLLDLFSAEVPELALREIAEQANMPKPTAYRLLSALESAEFIRKVDETGHYRLGLKLLELGRLVSDQLEVRKIALPFMQQLAMKINEAVHLVIVNHFEATYIEKVDSNQALRLFTRVGKGSPLYIGSGPKLLFAYLSAERQKEAIGHFADLEPSLNADELLKQLQDIRRQGYSYSDGEQDKDTTGISYPIFDNERNMVASLTVSGLSSHFTGGNLTYIKGETQRTASVISQKLGYLPEK